MNAKVALNKLAAFRERAVKMLAIYRHGEKPSEDMLFSEEELESLDKMLQDLATKLGGWTKISEHTWTPPVAYACRHTFIYKKGSPITKTSWLECFVRAIDNSIAFFMSFKEKENDSGNMIFNIGTVHGPVGKVENAPTTIISDVKLYDFSSIQQLLLNSKVPKHGRRELEDIIDELKESSSEKRPSILTRAEKWIAKHKELLGVGAELVGKVVGSAIGKSDS